MNSRNNFGRIEMATVSQGILGRTCKRVLIGGCVLAGTVLCSATFASAQFVVGPVWGGGGWGDTVGTAESSYLHGAADVVRSEGAYNLYTSQAMIGYEEARTRY